MENQKEEVVKKTDKQIIEEEKAKLKSKLDEKIALLKSQCKDAHFFDSIMDEIISLKGQYDVVPTRIFVREEDLLEEYDYGAFKLSRFTTGIAFHMIGYDFFVKPSCQTLYKQLDSLFESKGEYNALTQEQKDFYDVLFNATMDIIMTPPMCFCDDSYYIDIATYIMKRRNQLFKELDERPLASETLADEQFMSNVDLGEQLKESITKAVEDED
jgi:hypothetical protein